MTTTDNKQFSGPASEWFLQLAIPVIAFGVTAFGIVLTGAGADIGFQYYSIGCLVSSCILAYLAWIRPRKDIVSLSTPIYGIVFLLSPIDASAGAILQLFYAAGLTILLIRLKRNFSSAAPPPLILSKEEPLGQYQARMSGEMPVTPPEARAAARVFIRFAQGEYEQARQLAVSAAGEPGFAGSDLLCRAFAIVAEQAGQIATGSAVPATFTRFTPEQQPVLFHPPGADADSEQDYTLTLDNALILLFVAATGTSETGTDTRETLLHLIPFARKLCEA